MVSAPSKSAPLRLSGPPDGKRGCHWTVEWRAQVDSTQVVARGRGAWSAIVAGEQTAGRGQAERMFTSDPGGLYLTAVLPYAGDALKARGFALAVGWAVRGTLRRAGVRELRLRWPNDLMVGARKVGGILVEQGSPATLLVGVGLNVANHPWQIDPALRDTAGRLVDAIEGRTLPERDRLVERLLRAIGVAHAAFARRRLAGFGPVLNRCWGEARPVVLDVFNGTAATEERGWFSGIGSEGEVRLRRSTGGIIAVPAHHIRRLREVSA